MIQEFLKKEEMIFTKIVIFPPKPVLPSANLEYNELMGSLIK